VLVYCEKCKLVYAAPAQNRWGSRCFRCGGKLATEIHDWLMVIADDSLHGEKGDEWVK